MPKAIQFSVEDLQTPIDLERVLRQFQAAITVASVSVQNPQPSLASLAAQLAPMIGSHLQVSGSSPLNLTGLLPSSGGSSGGFLEDTHANRLSLYTPPAALGNVFFETDRKVVYVAVTSAGSLIWSYAAGVYVSTFANLPGGLATTETGFLFYATDQDNLYIWTGAAYDTISRRILLGGFFGIFTHGNTADRTYTLPDETGDLIYETTDLVAGAIVLAETNETRIGPGPLGTATTVLHGNAAGAPSYGLVGLTTDVSGVLPAANGGTGVSYNRISDTVALTAQVANITTVAFANSSTVGTYRCSYYLEDSTADVTAGTVTATFAFTDAAGATTVVSAAVALTGVGTLRTSGVFFIQLASGSITYAVAHTGIFGVAKYALYACLERLS